MVSPWWYPAAAPVVLLGLGELTPCCHPQGWCLCLFSFQNVVLRAKNLSFPLWHGTSVWCICVFSREMSLLPLHLPMHPSECVGSSCGDVAGLSANKGDTEWLPMSWGQISSAGTCLTRWDMLGSPGLVPCCPRPVPARAGRGATGHLGLPRRWGLFDPERRRPRG